MEKINGHGVEGFIRIIDDVATYFSENPDNVDWNNIEGFLDSYDITPTRKEALQLYFRILVDGIIDLPNKNPTKEELQSLQMSFLMNCGGFGAYIAE